MTTPDFRALSTADVHETRHELLERFKAAGACSAENVITIDVGTMSSDEHALFDRFVEQGVLVPWRGGYYLDERALEAIDRPTVRRAIIGAILVLALIGGLIWLFGR